MCKLRLPCLAHRSNHLTISSDDTDQVKLTWSRQDHQDDAGEIMIDHSVTVNAADLTWLISDFLCVPVHSRSGQVEILPGKHGFAILRFTVEPGWAVTLDKTLISRLGTWLMLFTEFDR